MPNILHAITFVQKDLYYNFKIYFYKKICFQAWAGDNGEKSDND